MRSVGFLFGCGLRSLFALDYAGGPFSPRNRRERGIVVGLILFLVVLAGAIVWMWHFACVF